ncbi:MAG: epoxyqueuosine reductase QueH [Coriobacteriia bacterium]
MRVLLHACCGPCLLEPYDALALEHDVTVAYANPNIHPLEEYRRRRDTLFAYTEGTGVRAIELAYEPEAWDAAVTPYAGDRATRCRACFRLRLGMVAERAAKDGFEAVATTLTVSPYQDQDAVREAGEETCEAAGVAFLATDFRDRYRAATERSRALGMYRQRYCGCVHSEAEADAERAQRKAERRRA